VSKTVNLPNPATPAEIEAVYRRAWEMGLKGITIYRYGSRGQQVLRLGAGDTPEVHEHFASCDPLACKL
jgi:ribonucleoside-diphosphate reductase alpha chain